MIDEVAQIEPGVEAIGKGCEGLDGVLAVLQRVERAGQCGFQVAQHAVDPIELAQIAGFAITCHDRQVQASGAGHRS